MKKIIQFINNKLGIDGAIFYTLLGRSVQICTALFTIFFITKYLSSDEQGYYFTFGSIVAIQIFFELGLNTIITQFVAHESSHLNFNENHELLGEDLYKSRLSSLLHLCAKWYLVLAVILLAALFIVGFFFFSKYEVKLQDIVWKSPWILLAIGTIFNFLLAPVTAFLEGLGKVKEVAQLRLVQQLIFPIVIWGGLAIGSKLFVSGANTIISVVVIGIIILKSPYAVILKNIWKDSGPYKVDYLREVFPYQWKIALSWISGYFIFQLFNPVLFASDGAQVAGQMGMTLTAIGGINSLTLSWFNTKVPRFSSLIAQKEYSSLDTLFFNTLKRVLLIGGSFSALLVIIIISFQTYNITIIGLEIGNRFLTKIPLILMVYSLFLIIPANAWAVYLRCHKREPLLLNSLVMGVLCAISAFTLSKSCGVNGLTIGFAFLQTIACCWVFLVFKKKRKQWHNNI